MNLQRWLAFTATATVLLLIPGPTILTVISYSISHGRTAAWPLVVGVALGARKLWDDRPPRQARDTHAPKVLQSGLANRGTGGALLCGVGFWALMARRPT